MCKLDLKDAYSFTPLVEESKKSEILLGGRPISVPVSML